MTDDENRPLAGDSAAPAAHEITTIEALEALYGRPQATSIVKEIGHVAPEYAAFIKAAPFLVIASTGPKGLDLSPRGDPAGFVRVVDEHTLDIPDRRGNNRIDTLRNIVHDPSVALIFLVPGIGETIRVSGTARILTDPALCEAYAIGAKPARTVLRVTVDRIYFQCQKALVRSGLWTPDAQRPRDSLPTAGDILAALSGGEVGGAEYDAEYPERMKRTIY